MSSRVAANCTNTIQCVRLWMCRLTFDPPSPQGVPREDSSKESIFDKYLENMRIQPLKEAYVMLIPTSTDTQSVPADPANAIFCRTTDEGELLRIDEGQIGSSVPPSNSSNWMLFSPEMTVVYYWTLSPKRFRHVVDDARKDYAMATRIHDFAAFQVTPQFTNLVFTASRKFQLELLEDRPDGPRTDAILQHALFTPPSANSGPGFLQGYLLKLPGGCAQKLKNYLNYVPVRRRVPDAIYAGELAQCHAIGLRYRSAKEFGIFSQARDIQHKAKTGEHSSELDAVGEDRAFREQYLQYAYICAKDSRVERTLFARAISYLVNDPERWQAPAIEIAKLTEYKAIHPCMDLDAEIPTWRYRPIDQWIAMRYFDFYRFGLESWVKETVDYAEESEARIQQNLETVSGQIARLMATIGYFELLLCLGNYPDEDALDSKIHFRYLELCANVYHDWSEAFEPEAKPWETLKTYVDDVGHFVDKVFGTYSEHYKSYENIQKYIHMLKDSAEYAEKFINKMVKWNDLLKGQKLRFDDPAAAIEMTAELETGLVWFKKGGKPILKMQLWLENVAKGVSIDSEQKAAQGFYSLGSRVRLSKAKVPAEFAKYHVEPAFKRIKVYPVWMASLGHSLALVVSVSEFIEALKKRDSTSGERTIASARLAKEVLETVDSFGSALRATLPYAKETDMVVKFAEVAEKLKGPGLCLEAVLNFEEGSVILFSEESEARLATIRGEYFEGRLQEAKGLVLVASAAPGIAAILTGAGVTAAGEVLAIPLAIAGLFVVGVDIYHYITYGPSNSMKDFSDALLKARIREFGERDRNRTADSLNLFSKTLDRLIANAADSARSFNASSN